MKKNGQKCETTNDMEAEEPPAPRRRTDMFPIQKDIIDLGMYMDSVQRKINRKIEMFLELKKKADYLSSKIN